MRGVRRCGDRERRRERDRGDADACAAVPTSMRWCAQQGPRSFYSAWGGSIPGRALRRVIGGRRDSSHSARWRNAHPGGRLEWTSSIAGLRAAGTRTKGRAATGTRAARRNSRASPLPRARDGQSAARDAERKATRPAGFGRETPAVDRPIARRRQVDACPATGGRTAVLMKRITALATAHERSSWRAVLHAAGAEPTAAAALAPVAAVDG